ncbi:MAG: hypothetical protein A3D31_11515 [Candidatus Fluviicola riflensis]|nr:MAG: hypothetical protein CHH17_15945 [Candidatus Fluviicola riflensis]OGS77617.1 MAG: hypothetical protein A3D31_11515 [Candidatus Fluviicola riflensis]OGS84200.1 MAG: hypothetical protein A3E30_12925 [Fluviicola sp. RIFCSPHIGHO2_12_FULL_43_24]OGS84683.1 MAG: hypothetical protein A2724_08450 [Fluviicola sp. RIFCSPHIGHO2_01_FULL_43_53]
MAVLKQGFGYVSHHFVFYKFDIRAGSCSTPIYQIIEKHLSTFGELVLNGFPSFPIVEISPKSGIAQKRFLLTFLSRKK